MNRTSSKTLSALALGLTLLGLSGCYNFHTVSEGQFYRSAQPMREEMAAYVRKKEIKTVLRLRGGGDYWENESHAGAADSGAKVIQIPISAKEYPTEENLRKIIDVFDQAEKPILAHCKAGADRTGLVSALYVLYSGGTMERAHEELKAIPYGHMSITGTQRMGETIELYRPWYGKISIREWADTHYRAPEQRRQEAPASFVEDNKKRAKAFTR